MRSGRALIILLGVGWLAMTACEPDPEYVSAPGPAIDHVRAYVAIGDGLTAGVQSGALTKRFQLDSYPALMAGAFGYPAGSFGLSSQPLIANPGLPFPGPLIPFGVLRLNDLSPLDIDRRSWSDPELAAASERERMHEVFELNGQLGRFRNLGVPGGLAYDMLFARDSCSCFTATLGGDRNFFLDVVLPTARDTLSPGVGCDRELLEGASTPVQMALTRLPWLTTVWLGFSEISGSALSGGSLPVPYDAATFGGFLDSIVVALQDGGLRHVSLANVPDPTSFPFFTTLPRVVVTEAGDPVEHPVTGGTVPLLGEGVVSSDLQLGVTVLEPGSLVLLSARDWLARGFGIPNEILIRRIAASDGVDEGTAAILMTARYPGHGQPLPDAVTLTPSERMEIEASLDAYNAEIAAISAARGAPLLDTHWLLEDLVTNGASIGNIQLTADFITGGLFSLDGIHPSSFGYALIADAWITVLNSALGAGVRPIDFGSLLNPPPLYF